MKKIITLSLITTSLVLANSINFKEANSYAKRVAPTQADTILSYHSSIENAKKSVVNIAVKKTLKNNETLNQMFDNPFFKEFFGKNFKIPQSKREASSLGSGVIISSNGYIITNNHVVEGADKITVTLLDNKQEFSAKVIGLDPDSDLAVIKIDAKNLHQISFANSKNLLEGDMVFAIGNPFGVGGSVTQGIISALNKSGIGLNHYENFIQTDASINPGNSGGALVDSRGALVGINSAILSRSGGNNGIGFAIPSNMVQTVASALIKNGKIERGYMGVSIGDLNADMKEVYTHKKGALILGVEMGKPAQISGLKRGDLIFKIDNKPIYSANELKNLIGSKAPGKEIYIAYERDNKNFTTSLKLDKLASNNQQGISKNTTNFLKGASLATINNNIRETYGIPKSIQGVIVLDVKSGSNVEKYGLKQGDIIVQIEQTKIKNIQEINTVFKNTKRKKIRLWVNRGGYIMPLLVR